MDDATQKMVTTFGASIVRKLLLGAGASMATHGIISSSQTETFVSIGMFAVGVAWSFWNDFGRAIVLSQLEVLKAKSLAQAAALKANGIKAPDAHAVAAASVNSTDVQTLTPEEVKKVAATLPAAVAGATALLALFCIMLLAASPAMAQRADDMARAPAARKGLPIPLPIDPLGLNNKVGTGSPLNDLLGALDAKLLPDLQYALRLAQASGSKVTAPCYSAWIDIINTRQAAVKDGDNAIPLPDPHLVTDFEKLVELRNSLQPESPFMIACSPVASMVKKDILGFIGTVIGGGAGLATLVPGL